MSNVAVVTAIISGRDILKAQPRLSDAAFIAFLDGEANCPGWMARPASAVSPDPVRNARNHKVLLHRWLPEVEYSLWIDGNVTLTCAGPLETLAKEYLRDTDVAVFRHRVRSCIYEEASACIAKKKDDAGLITRQVERYRAEGYPSLNGLAETAVLFRRHTQVVASFCELWWNEIAKGSRRDQLSFDYVAWKTGLRYSRFPGTLADNPLCWRGHHDGPSRD